MEITRTAKPVQKIENFTVWHCRGCGVVHMSVGKMVMNFTREEFSDLTEAVVDINYSGWPVRHGAVFDLMDHDGETHVNALVQ